MKIVTAEEMRAIDRATTEKYGVPSLTLMENAGTAVADFAQKHFEFSTVCVVCGKGNNGGDGFVAARKLHEAGKKVSVLVLAENTAALRGDAAEMFKKLPVPALWIAEENDFSKPEVEQALKADLIVDAILGTGFKPPLKGLAEKALGLINDSQSSVVAIDLPSGIDADLNSASQAKSLFVHADGITSFTAPKSALVYAELTEGPIAIALIGSPANLVVENAELNQDAFTVQDFNALGFKRKADANKGEFGHVLVIGGSVGKAGAAAMAGLAALRTGAGLVTIACPKSVQATIAAHAPELMTVPLDETAEGTVSLLALKNREELLHGKAVVVIGPGMSTNQETQEFIRDFTGICQAQMVIDADGLNAFAGRLQDLQPEEVEEKWTPLRVLTPHPGEMGRLLDIGTSEVQHSRIRMALRAATQSLCTVVLKGHRTVTASPDGYVWINTTGNPGMAKGGSGDVLSGIIAGLLAQREHIPGMFMLDLDKEIPNPGLQGIFRKVALQDPAAVEIKKLREKYRENNDPLLLSQIQTQRYEKIMQMVVLMGPLNVARAVYLHGLAGDIAASTYGQRSMIATDIIRCLGEAFAICEEEAAGKFIYLQR
ncbi:MAG TPA: NAD(P)H-hydrate dehydratase [Candidatus Angelobacter sp.]|jgi:NAD(P)H-hydrate epimerase